VRPYPSAVDGVGDDRQDVVDLGAEEREGHQGDDDDERHDQRVLGEALATLLPALSHGPMLAATRDLRVR